MNHLAFSLNEVITKFRQRNPNFSGEVSLLGTGFEALFLFDLLAHEGSDFWKLKFQPAYFYAFGMPVNLLTIRQTDLRPHFKLANCKKFYNILHPADPLAQRFEAINGSEFGKQQPEAIDAADSGRIDYILPDGSALELFNSIRYFTSELIILNIINQIFGALKMDSGM